jgi:biotin operon repressor
MSGLVMGRVFYTELPAHLKLTLLALADHAEDDGTGIFVGQARLARKTGASERAVRGHIAELRELGLIEKVGRVGSRGSDKHRVVVESLPTSEQIALMFPGRPAEVADRQKLPTGVQASPRPATQRSSTGNSQAAEPSEEPSVEPSSLSFDAFYEAFPRHQGKGSAKKAFTKALSKASAEELLASAIRYRNDPNREPGFTCLPATWLNQERWLDEPLPSRDPNKIPVSPAVPRSRRMFEIPTEELGAANG